MTASRALLVVFTRCNAPNKFTEWESWYDKEHLPALYQSGGYDVASRWQLTQKPVPGMPSIGFSHVTLYEINGADINARLEALFACDATLNRQGHTHPNHAVINVDCLIPEGRWSDKPLPSNALHGHILAYVMCNQANREAEWNHWNDDQHIPDMLHSGAFASASRWVKKDRSIYGANYLTLYDVHHPDIATAVAMSAEVMPGLIAAGRKLDCHVGAMTVTLETAGIYGGGGFSG